jgi:hypothetical protein
MPEKTRDFKIEILIPDAKEKGVIFKDGLGEGVIYNVILSYPVSQLEGKSDTMLQIDLYNKASEMIKEVVDYNITEII